MSETEAVQPDKNPNVTWCFQWTVDVGRTHSRHWLRRALKGPICSSILGASASLLLLLTLDGSE